MLSFKAADELGAASPICRLNQQRPTTGIGRLHRIQSPLKVRLEAVKETGNSHRCIVAHEIVWSTTAFRVL